jgi:hypothetical protein
MKININLVLFILLFLTLGCLKPEASEIYTTKELSNINNETQVLIKDILQKEVDPRSWLVKNIKKNQHCLKKHNLFF